MSIALRNQILKISLLIACLALLVLLLSLPINLTSDDIGRHIKNGELILKGHTDVLYKNFYSFTYPDYHFINHHWLFGFISYVVFRMSGFVGLSVFYILLLVIAFLLAFDSARRFSNFYFSIFLSVVSLLLLACRAQIRPEGFSVLFVALDFYLLQRYLQRSISGRVLFIVIPIVQIFWVNIHIFFMMGPVLVGLFLWQARLAGEDKQCLALLRRLLAVALLVNLINPSGLWGMLIPFTGFKQFSYYVSENQPVLFLIKSDPTNVIYKYFPVVAIVLMIGMFLALWRERLRAMPMVALGAFITIAAFSVVRLIVPFGFLFIPLASYCWAPYVKKAVVNYFCVILSVLGIIFCAVLWKGQTLRGIGLRHNVNASAEFFKRSGLKGPIFSNYDIGGYLIYHLADQEKLFVDNRYEAFPLDFFSKVYFPMQEDPAVWKDFQKKYGFNVVYFSRYDKTPIGQHFLVYRFRDPQWAPVFVDDYTIIFARRGSIDQGIIDRFELPKSAFIVTGEKGG